MAVCSILYQLATRQEEQEKIHEELLRVLPSVGTPLTSRHLDRMQYLRAFVKEVFRYMSLHLQLTELFQFLSLWFTQLIEKNEIIGSKNRQIIVLYVFVRFANCETSLVYHLTQACAFIETTVIFRMFTEISEAVGS